MNSQGNGEGKNDNQQRETTDSKGQGYEAANYDGGKVATGDGNDREGTGKNASANDRNKVRLISDAVRAANRENAKKSTGPKTEWGKRNSRGNAWKNGLTAKKIQRFENVPDSELDDELERWFKSYKPKEPWEECLVRTAVHAQNEAEVAWKLIVEERSKLTQEIGGDVIGITGIFNSGLKLPIDNFDLPIDRGWTVDRLLVCASSEDRKLDTGKGSHLQIQTALVSTIDKLTRYHSYWNKIAHRAMEALRAAQADRRERKGEE